MVEFTMKEGVDLVQGTQAGELIHYGTLRNVRHIDIVYSGPNPY